MINVSTEFKTALLNDQRNYLEYADITLTDGTVLNLTNNDIWQNGISIEEAVSRDNSFDIGSAIINKARLVINNIYDNYSEYDFVGATVILSIGLEVNGTPEVIRKGTYIVDETQYNGAIITLSLLDYMSKFDVEYTNSNLEYPATLSEIILDACSVCDVILNTPTFPYNTEKVSDRPEDTATTFREVIANVSQMVGCYAKCDRYGRLQIAWYDQASLEQQYSSVDGGTFDNESPTQYTTGDRVDGGLFRPWSTGASVDSNSFSEQSNVHNIYSVYSSNITTDDVVITGIKITVRIKNDLGEDAIKTYSRGTEGYVIGIENNLFITTSNADAILTRMANNLIGLHFRKASVQHSSDPTIEAGDVAILHDRKGNSYPFLISETRFAIGSSQYTACHAQTPAKNSAARFSTETKNYLDLRKQLKDEKTDREQALEELSQRLDTRETIYTTVERNSSQQIIAFYLHDKPTVAESGTVWKMTSEAWGVSTDGGRTWNAGMTVDGDTIVRILQTVGINAEWIKTGTITIGGSNNTHGIIKVLDASGNQVGLWNNIGMFFNRGQEWLKIYETTLQGGYGGAFDGILDLSAQNGNYRHVVLRAATHDLWLLSDNGTVDLRGKKDVRLCSVSGYVDIYHKNVRQGIAVASDTSSSSSNGTFPAIKKIYFQTAGANRFVTFEPTSGTSYTVAVSAISDKRVKTNINESKENAIDVINRIRHVEFDFKDENEHRKCGYIAQELKEINENFVVETKNDGENNETLFVVDHEILAYATKAIQELDNKNKELEKKITALEEMIGKGRRWL